MMNKINIDREDYYLYKQPELIERTKNRLTEISDMGMEVVGVAEFGVMGVVSGLYIEKVWRYSNKDWDDYIEWAKSVIEPK